MVAGIDISPSGPPWLWVPVRPIFSCFRVHFRLRVHFIDCFQADRTPFDPTLYYLVHSEKRSRDLYIVDTHILISYIITEGKQLLVLCIAIKLCNIGITEDGLIGGEALRIVLPKDAIQIGALGSRVHAT